MKLTKSAIVGMLSSLFMLAFFTAFWTGFMLWGFYMFWWGYVLAGIFVLSAVYLLLVAIKLHQQTKTLPNETISDDDKKATKRWNIIFGLQGGFMGLTCMILGIFELYEFIPVAVVLIVGIHYIPLGMTYHTIIHFTMSAFVVLVAIGSILLMIFTEYLNIGIGVSSASAAISTIVLGEYIIRICKSYFTNTVK
jgi:MFS family permease